MGLWLRPNSCVALVRFSLPRVPFEVSTGANHQTRQCSERNGGYVRLLDDPPVHGAHHSHGPGERHEPL